METNLHYKGNIAKKHVDVPKDASLNAELHAKHLSFCMQISTHTFFFSTFLSFCGLCTLKTHMHQAVVWLNVTSPRNVTNSSQLYLISPSLTVLLWTQPLLLSASAGVDRSPSFRSHPPLISALFLVDYLSIYPSVYLKRLSVLRRALTLHLL